MVNKYIKRVLAALVVAFPLFCGAQHVAINLHGDTGSAAAILDLSDTSNKHLGFLLPNVALTNNLVAAPVTNPPVGLLVFNTDTAITGNGLFGIGVYYWSGPSSGWLFVNKGGTSSNGVLSSGNGIASFSYNGSAPAIVAVANGTAIGQVYVTGASSPFVPSLQTMAQDAIIGTTGNVTVQGIEGEPITTPLINNGVLVYSTTSNTWVPTDITALSGNYIYNQTSVQSGANFNIGANGVIGGTLNVTGLSTLGSISATGNANINATGSGTTTIGNSTNNLTVNGNYTLNGNNGAAATNIGTGSTTGNVSIGGASNNVLLPAFTTNNEVLYTSGSNGTITATSAPALTNSILYYNGTNPVWGTLPSGSITANNGLTMSTATNVILGGTLNQITNITQATYSLDISGGTIGLNDGTSSNNTNINTGTSTGAVNIGNGTNTTITENGNYSLNNNNGAATTNIGTGNTGGNVTIGNANNSILLPAFYQVGDIPYISTTGGALNVVTPTSSSSTQVLTQSATSTTPTWQSLDSIGGVTNVVSIPPITTSFNNTSGLLTIGLTTPLDFVYGGTTGTAVPVAGGVSYGTPSGNYGFTSAGSSGNVLLSNGAAPPTWGTTGSNVVTADNGLSFSGTDVQLGGVLLQNTSIPQSGYNLVFDLGSGSTAGTSIWSIQNGGSTNPYITVKNSGYSGNPVQVGIGTSTPDPSAALDITSTTSGMLLPRLTQTQINALTSPSNGLMVYNLTTSCINVYSGGWTAFGCISPTCGTLPLQPTGLAPTTTFTYCGSGGTATYTLTVPGGSTQTSTVWTISPAGTVNSFSMTSASITIPNTAGVYTITATPFNSSSPPCSGPSVSITETVGSTPVITSPLSETVCAGNTVNYIIRSFPTTVTYNWFGVSNSNVTGITTHPQSSGTIPDVLSLLSSVTTPQTVTYSITLTSGSCPGSTSTLSVTVDPVPTVTTSPTYTVCSGTTESYVIGSNMSSTYNWTRGAVGNITPSTGSGSGANINEILTNSTTSPINVTYTIIPTATVTVGGCPGPAFTLTVTVNPSPILTSASSNSICSGGSAAYTITSNPSGTYAWTAVPLPTGISASTPTGTGNITGTLTNSLTSPIPVDYTLTLTANGCSSTAIYTVTVNPQPVITSATTGTICSGIAQTYTITSTISTANYSWTAAPLPSGITGSANGSGTGNNINETLTSTLTIPTVVVYTVTATYGSCSGTATYSVTVNPAPAAPTFTGPSAVCGGIVTTFTATGGTTYTWLFQTGLITSGSPGTGGTTNALTISNLTVQTTYTATIFSTNTYSCTSLTHATPTITVNPTPLLTASTATSFTTCTSASATTTMSVTSNITGVTYNWQEQAGLGTLIQAGASATVITPTAGTYTVSVTPTYTVTGNCAGTPVIFTFSVNATPTVTPVTPTAFCSGGTTSISLTSSPGGASFTWAITPNGVTGASACASVCGTSISQTLTYSASPGTVQYLVTPTSSAGCVGPVATITQTVNPVPTYSSTASVTQSPSGSVCYNTAYTYSVTPSATNASTYVWTFPSGTVQYGAGTTATVATPSIVLTYSCVPASGAIVSVIAKSAAGCSAASVSYSIIRGSCEVIYTYLTTATQSYNVPCGVSSLSVQLWGGGGGSGWYTTNIDPMAGGGGAYMAGTLSGLTGGSTVLTLYVPSGGGYASTTGVGGTAGWPGGGVGGYSSTLYSEDGGGGGGYAAIEIGSTYYAMAGGGGGGGAYPGNDYGGAGGATTGVSGAAGGGSASTGGSISSGGTVGTGCGTTAVTAGSSLTGGHGGGNGTGSCYAGGGGGAGYFGGAGGPPEGEGGGGGASYPASNITGSPGFTIGTNTAGNTYTGDTGGGTLAAPGSPTSASIGASNYAAAGGSGEILIFY